ncbi:MAG: DNA topoisomerase (ATP-hydrolyzing) subunit A [Waddliaceae bacterium]
MSDAIEQNIITRNVEDEMKDSYLRYSMSVIISRALPDVRDGLKPSQRRILYAMKQLNLSPGGKHRKCAKISGDTSGDYHPHGEQVIYPTLVRMAQGWVMGYPLVNGQGNFGSVDGDPPAAMRYTEARMTYASVQLMEDLDKQTVDMVPNYDETKLEPTVFPAKFPNLLCNGSSGIAVGMATNIPPHNFKEVLDATLLILDDPETTVDEILQVMPGPDFPSGGIICGYRGIKEAFHTGRGKVILRGKLRVDDNPNYPDRERIIVDEIPYNVNKSRLIEHIADLINSKSMTGISDLRDESDKDGMRIVIELKRGEIPEVTINQLYKYTDLQITFGCNMLALDHGMPRVMNVKEMIHSWVKHRIDVIRRRTRFELDKAEARIHIVEGYLKALDVLDRIVAMIRASQSRDEAKKGLIEQFDFTEKQANAVLDLRLYQLTGLEKEKIDAEHKSLLEHIANLKEILASEGRVKDIIREELSQIAKHHAIPRRTQIIAAEGDMDMEDLIANDKTIITISSDDYVKRMPVDTFREQRRGGQGVAGINLKKKDDLPKGLFIANAHDYLLIFTTFGRCYWIKAWQIPEAGRKSKGRPMVNLLGDLREGEKIATVLCTPNFEGESSIVMSTRKGTVKKTMLKEFSKPRRNGIWAIEIVDGDELVAARLVDPDQQVMLFTQDGMAVRFDQKDVRAMGRMARGVRGISLRGDDDAVISCEVVNGDETVLIVCENGFGKRSNVDEFRKTKRGGVGVRSIVTSDRNGKVVASICVTDTDGVLMISEKGQAIRIRMEDVRVMGRSTQGVKLANMRDNDHIVAIQKIEAEELESSENPESNAVKPAVANEGEPADFDEGELSLSDEGELTDFDEEEPSLSDEDELNSNTEDDLDE